MDESVGFVPALLGKHRKEPIMNNRQGKYTYLINWLSKEPLKYSDMNRLLKSIAKNKYGNYTITSKYRVGEWRKRKDYQGYGNTNLVKLTGGTNPRIKKNASGKYEPTAYGWANKEHPFKRSEQDLEKERQWKAERIARYERAKKARPQRIIEFVEFEKDEYKLIRKMRIR